MIKQVWYWHKVRYFDKLNRMQSLDKNKKAKQNISYIVWINVWKKLNLNPYLPPYIKTNLRRIIQLNLKFLKIKPPEESTEEYFQELE